jgi:hypothetical protein
MLHMLAVAACADIASCINVSCSRTRILHQATVNDTNVVRCCQSQQSALAAAAMCRLDVRRPQLV